jgi:2-dehydro-3-deoxygalactonokinase
LLVIAVDWGTSSLRAYRLDGQGRILEQREAPKGILSVAAGQFPRVLAEQIAGWNDPLILMSGMVGSRQGWTEVPYVQCPAGPENFAAHLKKVEGAAGAVWIVPGLSCVDSSGVPDVMRGEETQLLGVLDDLPANAVVCLPGTHSKWVQVHDRTIESFSTYMTGELFAVLRQHSLLGRMMEEGPADEASFAAGVARSGEEGGLLHHLFGVRTLGLFGELSPKASPSYLSGLLIGHELRCAGGDEFHLLGSAGLAAAYQQGAALLGITCRMLDAQAAARGLFTLGKEIGT